MRTSCNGCRVLRKACNETCAIRPCLHWIKNPESQARATLFLAKFYGRAGLLNLLAAAPENMRPGFAPLSFPPFRSSLHFHPLLNYLFIYLYTYINNFSFINLAIGLAIYSKKYKLNIIFNQKCVQIYIYIYIEKCYHVINWAKQLKNFKI